MKKRLLILLSFSILSVVGYGQLASPSVSAENGGVAGYCAGTATGLINYTGGRASTEYTVEEIPYNPPYSFDPVAGSTLIPLPPPNQNQDDFWANQLFTLPFSFSFYGNNYNTVSIGSNGVISFNTTGTYAPGQYCPWPIAAGGLPNATPIRNAIFGVLQDINFTTLPYPETSINYYVYDQGENVAPSRVFILNVNKVLQFGDGTNPDTNVAGVQSYQIILYETTNIIDVYVKRRVPYNPWNSGRGIIGIINNNGTDWEAAPNSNGTNFTAINKAYRFSPAGVPTATVQWYLNGAPVGPVNGSAERIDINPAAEGDIITAEVTYHNGNVSQTLPPVDMTVGQGPVFGTIPDDKKIICPGDNGPYEFEIENSDLILAGNPNPLNYEIYYYENEQDAIDEALNYITNTAAFPVNGSNLPKTIWASVKDISGTDCKTRIPFILDKIEPVGGISYDPVICKGEAGGFAEVTMSPDLMTGGEFLASSTDLVVDPVSGIIDLALSQPGTYTVDYYPVPDDCPNLKMSSQSITIVQTPTAAFTSASGNVCPNISSPLAFSGTPGAIISYSRTNATDGTVNETITVQADGTAVANYVINEPTDFELLKVSSNTTPSCEFVFNPTVIITYGIDPPTATITGADDTDFCPGGSTIITVQGTVGGTVNYTGPSGPGSVLLDATTGIGTFNTQALNTANIYTYTLNDITVPGCATAQPITGQSIDITVNPLPDVTAFITTTPTVCEGTSATLNFTGTPNATVNYKDAANNLYDVTIPVSGNISVQTPALSGPTSFTLIDVVSDDLCTKALNLPAVSIAIATNPVITTQPVAPAAALCQGQTFTLSVQTTGTGLHYTWYHNNVPVNPAVDSNVYSKTATSQDGGDYRVEVSGQCTPPAPIVVSNTVQVTVYDLTIVSQPTVSGNACVDDNVTLSVDVQGSGVINYDWKKDGVSIPGAPNSPQLVLSGVMDTDAGSYRCLVSNGSCSILSDAAVVVVNLPLLITEQPDQSLDICNESGTLTVTATGTPPFNYQWKRDGANVGTNSPTLTIEPGDAGTYDYEVVVSDFCTSVNSTISQVVIAEAVTIVSQPSSPELCSGPGNSLVLHVGITGGGSDVHYQWQRDGQDVGTDSPDYIVSVPDSEVDSGTYIVKISNGDCPDVFSNSVFVDVKIAPVITQQPVSRTVCVNELLAFFVEVETEIPVYYHWFHNGTELVGADQPTYTVQNAALTDAGTYRVVISTDTCPDIFSSTVTAVVRPLPDATVSNGAQSTICDNTGTDVIFTGTPNAIVTYTVNGGEEQTITLNPSGSARLLTGVLSETTTYTLVSVAANDNPPCPKLLTGEAVVTVLEIPDPELDQDGYICLDPVSGQTMTGSSYELNTGLSTADGYTFVWYLDNVEILGATEGTYDAVAAGNYEVTITDTATGCTDSATAPIVTSTPPLTITAQVDTLFFADNASITVTATPAGDYEYRLDDGPWQTDNVFTGVRTILTINNTGDHTVYVRDAKACDELSYDVKVIDYPKYFTPNGDGYHDTWNIPTLSNQPGATIFIFDRYGKLLKEISTTNPTGWDGTYNGQPMTADDYWFVVKYAEQGINKEFRAHFAIKR